LSGIAPQLTATNGLACASAAAVDRARDQFLADAGFAFDQHRDVRLRRARAQPEHLAHLGTACHQIVEQKPVVVAFLQPRYFA
jgi:hypothetical protein